ncbi:helix-turn-helix domain-containing protein [Leptospira interrogans serovar Weerasinghe]|uniref:helix-turn-helix domain-containing protein n=1 Tax=Leptospira interrogans TaxID=173 RepID=UPI00122C77F2|nr:helix-turn-helix domain-containing protein [Leptospira interrogans]KAA1264525.1 helix-turn-helix domain-containing protein [Leptospira interrogans serovar Weerasinghe]UML83159.1 helix-turn-helix domain-containing protein [Leptospira interrogans]UML83167.1 helix-turn-helix domain-containing protein [Leptospira interrogans]
MNDTQRVFRVQKDRNFTIVKNNFIDDARLSMKATAILLLALRYPDHWRMSVKTMSKFKSDKDSSIASGFKELVTFGYAEFRKGKDPVTGRFNSGWYFFEESQKPEVQYKIKTTQNKNLEKQKELFLKEVKESNIKENPVLDFPQPENPVTVNPGLENQPLSNTIYQRLSKQVFSSQIQNTTREYDQPPQARIEEELEIKFKREKNQALGSPQAEKPQLDFQGGENQPLSSTIYQGLSKQVLFKQILNTTREYGPPAKTHLEEQKQNLNKPKPLSRFQFPDSWLIKFQDYYFREHGSEMGQPDSELKALSSLYEISKGDWNLIESKIQTLIQLRKQDPKFWYEQSLSPESITKFWSRLFERKVKPTEKNTKRNEPQNKSKYNESKTIQETPIEEINNLDPYKCFLGWGKSKLLKSQLEYYEQNSDPFKYEGTKKILFEKFVNEVYPGLVNNSEVKKTTIENRKGSAA